MGREIRILIVEDEFMISEDIAMRLSDFGYTISGIADNAEKALEILANGKTDMALLDININGDMDGIQLAAKIREKYKIPFIFLTSFANKAIVERANETNPSAYLQIAIDMALYNFSNNISPFKVAEKTDSELVDHSLLIYDSGLFLKKETHFIKVDFDQILYLEAEGSYTAIYTKTDKFLYAYVLKSVESKLSLQKFKLKCHYGVRRQHVTLK
jgi:DNA-binding LytR/AlgR family response regulator